VTTPATQAETGIARRGTEVLYPNASRVLARLFLPGQEILAQGISRADAIIGRVLALPESDMVSTLASTRKRFSGRHQDIEAIFAEHFALVRHRLAPEAMPELERRQLIGACFTQEYAVEAAALFNPSIVAHPDQSGLGDGEVRFLMSLRALGEGHISSIEFRTGTLAQDNSVHLDEPAPFLTAGRVGPATLSREFMRAMLADGADIGSAAHVLSLLPAEFDAAVLEEALNSVTRERLTRRSTDAVLDRIRSIASADYTVQFAPDVPMSARTIFPSSADESRGIEDARFTRFVDDDESISYYATYTAFDGNRITPRLLRTTDFTTFDVSQIAGPAAKDKGMALFPRRIDNRYYMLSRWDRENVSVASSTDARIWSEATTIYRPTQPWELIQLGNCGAPVETANGWLVLTHGVGPVRTYGIGAILLDLDDPTVVIGSLREPLLTPADDERDGYVPNVVYSCGSMIHNDTLVLPYGCSDSAVRFAFVDVPTLLERLQQHRW